MGIPSQASLAEGPNEAAVNTLGGVAVKTMEKEVIEAQPQLALAKTETAPLTPMGLIDLAMRQGAGVEQLEKLLALQERWEANEARKAYVEAINQFKANPPDIQKNKHVEYKEVKYDHATLDQVTDKITTALSAVGISHRWEVGQQDGKIRVTCVLTHRLGHSEATSLEGPADTTGSKNAIQAIGSAVTYLQRYSLLAATGLAVKGQDTDGNVTNGEFKEQLEWLASARDMNELQRLYSQAYKATNGNKHAQSAVIAAKDRRKAELVGAA